MNRRPRRRHCILAVGLIAACVSGNFTSAAQATTPPVATPATPTAAQPDPGSAPSFGQAPAAGTPADPSSSEDIRDIRGPKGILPAWVLPAVLAGIAALALLGYGVWRWRRRQRPAVILLPFEIALQRLEAIRPLMQPESVREFSIAVSDVVRRYIEERFQVTAAHRTTEEFLHDRLSSSDPSLARHHALLADFLQYCDLAKFAGMSLTQESMESLRQSARSFVVETAKPTETPQSKTAPAQAA